MIIEKGDVFITAREHDYGGQRFLIVDKVEGDSSSSWIAYHYNALLHHKIKSTARRWWFEENCYKLDPNAMRMKIEGKDVRMMKELIGTLQRAISNYSKKEA